MTKSDAIALFGSPEALRVALRLRTRQAVYMWGEQIPERHELRIRHVLLPDLGAGDVGEHLRRRAETVTRDAKWTGEAA